VIFWVIPVIPSLPFTTFDVLIHDNNDAGRLLIASQPAMFECDFAMVMVAFFNYSPKGTWKPS